MKLFQILITMNIKFLSIIRHKILNQLKIQLYFKILFNLMGKFSKRYKNTFKLDK